MTVAAWFSLIIKVNWARPLSFPEGKQNWYLRSRLI